VRAARAKVRKCAKCGLVQARLGKAFKCQACEGMDDVLGLPVGFRYHHLRHYLASLLIANGADVKTVQARLRHGLATTTLNTYSHLRPDKDESTKAIVDSVIKARSRVLRTPRGLPGARRDAPPGQPLESA
jgi:Phage integrase family